MVDRGGKLLCARLVMTAWFAACTVMPALAMVACGDHQIEVTITQPEIQERVAAKFLSNAPRSGQPLRSTTPW